MRTPVGALVWELWHVSRWELALRITVMCLMLPIFSPRIAPGPAEGAPVLEGVALILLYILSVFSATWLSVLDNVQTGFTFRLGFCRPVSTFVLVAVPLGYTIVTSLAMYIVPAALGKSFFGIDILSWQMATIIACTVTCFVWAAWSPTTFATRLVALAAVAAAMAAGLGASYVQNGGGQPIVLALGDGSLLDFNPAVYAALVALAALAALATVRAVERQRHGDTLRLWPRGERLALPARAGRAAARPFASPATAQAWYEMRRAGVKLLGLGLAASIVLLAAALVLETWYAPFRGQSANLWLLVLAVSPMVCQILGAEWSLGLRRTQGVARLPTFDAARGLEDGDIVAIKLGVLGASTAAVWLMLTAAAAAQGTLSGQGESWLRVGTALAPVLEMASIYWWMAGAISLLVFLVGQTALLIAFGLWLPRHERLLGGFLLFVFASVILAVLDTKRAWSLASLWHTYAWLGSLVLLVASAAALRKAYRTRLLRRAWFGYYVCGWIISVCLATAVYRQIASEAAVPLWLKVLGIALLTLPLSAVALTALALSAHRHE